MWFNIDKRNAYVCFIIECKVRKYLFSYKENSKTQAVITLTASDRGLYSHNKHFPISRTSLPDCINTHKLFSFSRWTSLDVSHMMLKSILMAFLAHSVIYDGVFNNLSLQVFDCHIVAFEELVIYLICRLVSKWIIFLVGVYLSK